MGKFNVQQIGDYPPLSDNKGTNLSANMQIKSTYRRILSTNGKRKNAATMRARRTATTP